MSSPDRNNKKLIIRITELNEKSYSYNYIGKIGIILSITALQNYFKLINKPDDYIKFIKYIEEECRIIIPEDKRKSEEIINNYLLITINQDRIYIFPRFLLRKILELVDYNNNTDKIKIENLIKFKTEKIENEIKFLQPLWDDKIPIIDKLSDILINSKNDLFRGCILSIDTGKGKTITMLYMVKLLQVKTIIFTKNTALQKQMLDDLAKNIDISNLTIAILGGDGYKKKKNMEKLQSDKYDILICIINSGYLQKPEFFNKFSFAIFDECHSYCAKERIKVLKYCQCKYMLGLSATPELKPKSKWGKYFIGQIITPNEIPNYVHNKKKEFIGKVDAIHYMGAKESTYHLVNKNGDMNFWQMLDQFADDEYRNKLILYQIVKLLLNKEQHIFCFASGREILIKTYNKILELRKSKKRYRINIPIVKCEIDQAGNKTFIHEDNWIEFRYCDILRDPALFIGGADKEEIEKAYQTSNIIFATYQIFADGGNIPKQTAIIFLTPLRNNMKQITGRILRGDGDITVCRYIIDIIDQNTGLKSQFDDRLLVYEERNFTIRHIYIKYNQFEIYDIMEIEVPKV